MDRIHCRRLTYYGHVIRMSKDRLFLITLNGTTKGTKPKGRPPKRWIDCCKESCLTRGTASLTDARWHLQDSHKWRTFSSSSSYLDRAEPWRRKAISQWVNICLNSTYCVLSTKTSIFLNTRWKTAWRWRLATLLFVAILLRIVMLPDVNLLVRLKADIGLFDPVLTMYFQ